MTTEQSQQFTEIKTKAETDLQALASASSTMINWGMIPPAGHQHQINTLQNVANALAQLEFLFNQVAATTPGLVQAVEAQLPGEVQAAEPTPTDTADETELPLTTSPDAHAPDEHEAPPHVSEPNI